MALKTITWTHDGKYADGSDFTAADFAGFTLSMDGQPAVSVPAAWVAPGGVYSAPVDIAAGKHSMVMYTVAKNGETSDPSGVLTVDTRKPKSPFGLRVA